jgi:hypothetical protein
MVIVELFLIILLINFFFRTTTKKEEENDRNLKLLEFSTKPNLLRIERNELPIFSEEPKSFVSKFRSVEQTIIWSSSISNVLFNEEFQLHK